MSDDKINMCDSRGSMSVCTQHESPKNQKQCKHYEKASTVTRCMFLMFDEFCDNLKAQTDKQVYKDKITKFLEENQKRIDEEAAIEEGESQIEKISK